MRLTDDRTYFTVKKNADGLSAKGFEVSVSDQMYIKLAEYERNEEQQHNTVNAIVEENAALRAELKEAYAMNSRLREALQRQSVDNYEYE